MAAPAMKMTAKTTTQAFLMAYLTSSFVGGIQSTGFFGLPIDTCRAADPSILKRTQSRIDIALPLQPLRAKHAAYDLVAFFSELDRGGFVT